MSADLEPPFLVGVTDDFPGGNDDDLVEWAFEAGIRYQSWHSSPRTIVEWGAAHQENGVVHNVHPTRDKAQAFVDSMAEVGHPMIVKRREHTPGVWTAWEPVA